MKQTVSALCVLIQAAFCSFANVFKQGMRIRKEERDRHGEART